MSTLAWRCSRYINCAKRNWQQIVILLVSLSLLFNTFFIAAQNRRAHAQTERITRSFNSKNSYYDVDIFHDRLNRVAYCVEYGKKFIGEAAYTIEPFPDKRDVVWLVRNAPQTIEELNRGQTLLGKHFSHGGLMAIYQLAIWLSTPEFSSNHNPKTLYGNSAKDHHNELKPYVDYLLSEAKKHINDPAMDPKSLVLLKNPSSQTILARAFEVDVTFTKTSAMPNISQNNGEYSFAGATYDIYLASNNAKVATITLDSAGRASLKLLPNTAYYAMETANPKGFRLETGAIRFTTQSNNTTVGLQDVPATVKIRARKVDALTGGESQIGTSLAEATYTLVDASGIEHSSKTNDVGEIQFDNVALGAFRIREAKAPAGYVISTEEIVGQVGANDHASEVRNVGVINYTLEDPLSEIPIAFDIEIAKFTGKNEEWDASDGQEIGAAHVRFDIISNTTGEVVGTIETDESGFADTASDPNLWFGKGKRNNKVKGALPYDEGGYTICEVASTVPSGFDHVDDFTISKDQMLNGVKLHYILNDKQLDSRLQIVKVDVASQKVVPLAGFSFELLNANKEPVSQELWYPNHTNISQFTTDETGSVTLPERLLPGTYYVKEIAAAAPYLLQTELTQFEISNTYSSVVPISVVRISDTKAKGQALLQKKDAALDISKSTLDFGQNLSGAEFDVVATEDIVAPDKTIEAAKGEIVDHITTNESGFAQTKELPLGSGVASYAFIERKAPDGYILDPTPRPFSLSYQDQMTAVVVTEVSVENTASHVRLLKKIKGSDRALANVEFEIWNNQDNVYFTPSEIPSLALAAGPGENYYLTTKGDNPETISLSYSEAQGVYIASHLTGTYSLFKDDVELATFELASNKTTFAEAMQNEVSVVESIAKPNTQRLSVLTDENGIADIIHLPHGTYCIREKSAPKGYLVDPATYRFTVDENGLIEGKNTYEITIENDYTKVGISKLDITGQTELQGASLRVLSADGATVDEWISTSEPHLLEAIAPGEYILEETMSPRTYDLTSRISFKVLPTGEVQKVEMKDEPIKIEGVLDKRQEIADPTAAYTEANGDGKNTSQTTISEEGIYKYYLDFQNNSSTWTDEFTVTDELKATSSGLAKLVSITTPMALGDRDGLCNLWYKTNKVPKDFIEDSAFNATLSDKHENPWLDTQEVLDITGDDRRIIDYAGWKIWKADIDTTEAQTILVTDLKLADDEYVTAIRFEYGSVDKGFTTRANMWDRENLKDEHDDMYQVDPNNGEALSSACITMQVTDAYNKDTKLENEAKLSIYRNGGGDDLEDHDEDKVVQTPKTEVPIRDTPPLHKTGDSIVLMLLCGLSLTALVTLFVIKHKFIDKH